MATTLNNYSTLANATILAGSADLVSDGFSVYLDGTLFNAGTLAMDANANGDSLILVGAAVSLVGGGTVLLSDNPKNYIYGSSADDDTLINVNNTIEGAGYLGQTSGYQPIAFSNEAAGIVDADDGAPLVIETSGMTAFNEGELEATGAGGLVIYGSIIDQTGGGEILASGAGTVYLEGGADILGGTLSDVSGGDIDVFSGGATFGAAPAGGLITIAAATTVQVINGNNLYLFGTIDNFGTLYDDSANYGTGLVVSGPTVSLTGGGTVLLSDNASNLIHGSGANDDTLINVNNTISGAGFIGQNGGNQPIAFTNEADGVLDANESVALVIETSGQVFVNDGKLEATGAGGLTIYGSPIDQTGGGQILASGTGGVYLEGGSDILGGTLSGTLGGEIFVFTGGATLGGPLSGAAPTIAAATTVEVINGNDIYLAGTIDNLGTLYDDSANYGTGLVVNTPTVNLIGGGMVLLSDNANNLIHGSSGGDDTLVNFNNTIAGAGFIGQSGGNQPIAFVNEAAGIIDADQSVALVIETSGQTFVNDGNLEATGAGGLTIYGSPIDQTGGGRILATGTGEVYLEGGSDILGGTLSGTLGGDIFVSSGGATLGGPLSGAVPTIAAGTTVDLINGNDLYLAGTIDNLGTLYDDSANYGTGLVVDSPTVSLIGGGLVLLSDNTANEIYGSSAGDETLVNVNNTIAGAGQIGVNNDNLPIALTNQVAGIVDADGGLLLVQTGGPSLVNQGKLEATNGGTLAVDSALVNDGSILAAAGASLVVTGALSGTGVLADAGYAELAGVSAGQIVSLDGAGGVLQLDDAAGFAGKIAGFSVGDTIELAGFDFTSQTYVAGVGLELGDSGGTITLDVTGAFSAGQFQVTQTSSGTRITLVAAPPGAAVTLQPGMPRVSIGTAIDTFGLVGTYGIGGAGTVLTETVGAALFGAAGTDFTLTTTKLIESDGASPYDAGIVLGGPGTVTNTGTVIGAAGIEIFGAGGGAAVDNARLLRATLGSGIYLQGNGEVLNAGTLQAQQAGIVLGRGGEVTNKAAASIIANAGAGVQLGAVGYAYNYGAIDAGKAGIDLSAGGAAYNSGRITAGTSGIYGASGDVAVYNYKGATITGAQEGVSAAGSAEIINYGVILATDTTFTNAGGTVVGSHGVLLTGGGAVTNETKGTIIGNTGIGVLGGAGGYVYNYGTVSAARSGIYLNAGAVAYNSGVVSAEMFGVYDGSGAAAVYNYKSGRITGTADGVDLKAGGNVYNAGFISGGQAGILMRQGGTIFDSGTINGGTNGAVDFSAGFAASSRLIITPAAHFSGTIQLGGGALELVAAGKKIGTIAPGSLGLDAGQITIDKGAVWDLAGAFATGGDVIVLNDGTLNESGNTGAVTLGGALMGAGLVDLGKQVFSVDNTVAAGQNFAFTGTGETLALGDAAGFSGKIKAFAVGDAIDLTGVSLGGITGTHFAKGVLTLDETAGSLALTFASPSGFGSDVFLLTADGAGTAISLVKKPAILPNVVATAGADTVLPALTMSEAAPASYSPSPTAATPGFISAFSPQGLPSLVPAVTLHA